MPRRRGLVDDVSCGRLDPPHHESGTSEMWRNGGVRQGWLEAATERRLRHSEAQFERERERDIHKSLGALGYRGRKAVSVTATVHAYRLNLGAIMTVGKVRVHAQRPCRSREVETGLVRPWTAIHIHS